MDPLVPAFVAVLLAGASDRPPLLAAILSDRSGRGALWGAIVAEAAGFVLAAIGGRLAAPILTPNARDLMLAVALIGAATSVPFPARIKDRLGDWRLPPFLTGLLGMAVLTLGDRSQFLVFALVARTPDPVTGAVGGALAGAILLLASATFGERDWLKLPLAAIRAIATLLLGLTGAILGLGALRLL
ncbi:TMEM165/GDT1 family protein [Sphingomonas sp. Leaf62]|uniref:TMEM165/GDT1 family protein n=1 Tax=Sphingomonas sp. Leaf62 TaxID=1736228 RepID=UPI0006FF2AA3|nr:TMEM165/GDT1 family protein [Sphingomonas sp. Leaf62]KQN81358.1 hypothetical protein ASE91_11085 [Sphingomonas sp. Leaf62]